MRLPVIVAAALLAAMPVLAQDKKEALEEVAFKLTLDSLGKYIAGMECLRKKRTLDEAFIVMAIQDLGEKHFQMAKGRTGGIIERARDDELKEITKRGACPAPEIYGEWVRLLATTYQLQGGGVIR